MENNWKEYLTFTKKERSGILILVFIIGVSAVSPWFFPGTRSPNAAILAGFEQKAKLLEASPTDTAVKAKEEYASHYFEPLHNNEPELFYFDPNTLDKEGWQKLGLRAKTIQTIQKYIAGGGRFYKPGDMRKIYGLKEKEYERIAPYIRIISYDSYTTTTPGKKAGSKSTYRKEILPVDINMADTTAFIALPGIGSKLAKRLIGFREKLGGFYSVDQVAELYGLPDSTFQQLKQWLHCTSPATRKININTAAIDSLKQHPYIKWNLANAIVQYRQQHGLYRSVAELQQIALVTPEIYSKIVVYLSVE